MKHIAPPLMVYSPGGERGIKEFQNQLTDAGFEEDCFERDLE